MPQIYISVGSNIDRARNVRSGVDALRRSFSPIVCSSLYESESVGFEGDNFYNLVVGFCNDSPVFEVVKTLHAIEENHGRSRNGARFSPRTLDLDLLLYGDEIIDDGGISIPRDEILTNAFVLQPLAEISPAMKHPQLGVSFASLWHEFDKESQPLWKVSFVWSLDTVD